MRRALFRAVNTGLAFNSMGTCKHYDVTRSYIHIVKPLDADIQKGYVTAITSISSSGENQTDQKGETAAACEINIGGVDSVGKADGRDTGESTIAPLLSQHTPMYTIKFAQSTQEHSTPRRNGTALAIFHITQANYVATSMRQSRYYKP